MATSSVVSAALASPSTRPINVATASGLGRRPSVARARSMIYRSSLVIEGFQPKKTGAAQQRRVHRKERVLGGRPDQNEGAVLDRGRRASCWARLKRWTSSRKKIVPRPCSASSRRAAATVSRTSFTPALTADMGTNAFSVAPAITWARVVFPVPGRPPQDHRRQPVGIDQGPQRSAGGQRWVWPTISSRVRGRIRAARGAWAQPGAG